MLRYYIIREEDGHINAIHKVRDSAQSCFVYLCSHETFRGDTLQLVVVDVDDHGIVKLETLSYMYMRGDNIVIGVT